MTFSILIVDDTPANVRILEHLLQNEGYKTLSAFNGDDAISMANSHHPDIILLDVVMPGISGYEVCRQLKADKKFELTPILFLSALSNMEDKLEGFRAGGVDFLTKPYQKEEILARLNTHVQLLSLYKIRDDQIQELKIRGEQLQRLNSEKDELMRMLSHDIKNPLSGIIGLVDIIKDDPDVSDEERLEMLGLIGESGNKLLEMVKSKLDSQAVSRDMLIETERVDIESLIDREIFILQPKARIKNIAIVKNIDAGGLTIVSNSQCLIQIVSNLIDNAIEYSKENTQIKVSLTTTNPAGCVIVIEDNGPGIPQEVASAINNGLKVDGKGLSILLESVKKLMGAISVESSDSGTVFTVSLPQNGFLNKADER